MDDLPDSDYSDNEFNEKEHLSLIEAVTQLDGKQRVKPPSRKEPSLEVSEFHLVKSGITRNQDLVVVSDLAKVLGKNSSHANVGREILSVIRKSKTLPKPLEKNEASKIKREVGFTSVKKDLDRWEAVVHKNRVSELQFPLESYNIQTETTDTFLAGFKTQSELEKKMAEVLHGSNVVEEIPEEEALIKASLSLKEMIEYRKEMAGLRAQQSYREAKAARQKKIKSKKYHRIQRRAAHKQLLKTFEVLQKSDPEAALKQLEELDRFRAEERMSLRHRNTGHWARSKAVRAKYDKESRQVLAEQLAISRDLTKKVRVEKSSEEEDDDDDKVIPLHNSETDNPWTAPNKDSEVGQFYSGYRKFLLNQQMDSTPKLVSEDRENQKKVTLEGEDLRERPHESGVTDLVNKDKRTSMKKHCSNGHDNHENLLVGEREKSVKSPVNVSTESIEEDFTLNLEEFKKEMANVKTQNKLGSKKRNKGGDELPQNVKRKKIKHKVNEQSKTIDTIISAGNNSSWVATTVTNDSANLSKQVKRKCKQDGKCQDKKHKVKRNKKVNSEISIDELFEDTNEKLQKKVKVLMKKMKKKNTKNINKVEGKNPSENDATSSLAFTKKKTLADIDEVLMEQSGDKEQLPTCGLNQVVALAALSQDQEKQLSGGSLQKNSNIDPNKFLAVKPKFLVSQLPDVMTPGDEAMDDEEEEARQLTIAEAFADDDVVADFSKEKQEAVEKSLPKDIDLSMPGWGSWGGTNLTMSERKKHRFIIKAPKDVPRRDDGIGNVIINEDKNVKIKEHLVSDLPFPFKSVKDFEASIRAPIGSTWVPQIAHTKLIKPQVITKMGTIIKPMDKSVLLKHKLKRLEKELKTEF